MFQHFLQWKVLYRCEVRLGLACEAYGKLGDNSGGEWHFWFVVYLTFTMYRTAHIVPSTTNSSYHRVWELWRLRSFVAPHSWFRRMYIAIAWLVTLATKKDMQHINAYNDMLPYLTSRSTQLNQEFAFLPSSPPRTQGGIFELRSYQLLPGKLLEWESTW